MGIVLRTGSPLPGYRSVRLDKMFGSYSLSTPDVLGQGRDQSRLIEVRSPRGEMDLKS